MSTIATTALVEEAEKLSQRATPGPWRVGTVHAAEEVWAAYPDGLAGLASERLLLRLNPNFTSEQDTAFIARARTLVPEFAAALRRAEAERDAAIARAVNAEQEQADMERLLEMQHERTRQADELWRKQHNKPLTSPDLGALIEWLMKRAEQAEAERDAQHEQVLRLTGELEALATKTGDVEWREDAAVEVVKMRGRQISELTATRDLLLTENARLQQQLSRPDPVVHETPVDGVVPCCGQKLHDLKDGARVNEGPLVNCDRMRLLSRVGEVSSANLLLTAENERLQQEHNAYCRKLANDGLTVASRLQGELDALRAENETLHYLLNGVR